MKILEAHSGLSALLIEKSPHWDGIWVSSLTHAASKGLPDNELVPLKERVDLVTELKRVSTKPIIVDVDTFGSIEHIPFHTKWFEDAGAWAIVMEDKKYPKQNSLLEKNEHQLEEIEIFCEKINVAKTFTKRMKIIARLESLIAERSMEDALARAAAYVDAGADMILIHSKEKVSCFEVTEFAKRFKEINTKIPLVAIPTTYDLNEDKNPFTITIYANQMFRAAFKVMAEYANATVPGQRPCLATVKEIFKVVGH